MECSDGTLYCGWTTDLEKRQVVHNQGKGARYTRCRLPVSLVYFEAFDSRSEAQKREHEIKNINHDEKIALVENFDDRDI